MPNRMKLPLAAQTSPQQRAETQLVRPQAHKTALALAQVQSATPDNDEVKFPELRAVRPTGPTTARPKQNVWRSPTRFLSKLLKQKLASR